MNNWKGLPLVIFGCGGAAKEARVIINDINYANTKAFDFLGFVSQNDSMVNEVIEDMPVICSDEGFYDFSKDFPILGVALPFESPEIKRSILERLKVYNNLVFPNIIHPKAVVAKSLGTRIGLGTIIGINVLIDPDVNIGNFVFINMASTVGHDTEIGDFTTIHMSANISGNCTIGRSCIIGTNVCIRQGTNIGNGSICGMGAIVVNDVRDGATVISNKAVEI